MIPNDIETPGPPKRDVVILTIPPQMQWEMLKREILLKIKEIDDATPWSEKEPQWWLEMNHVKKEILNPE